MDMRATDANAGTTVNMHTMIPVISFDNILVAFVIVVDQQHREIQGIVLELSHRHC